MGILEPIRWNENLLTGVAEIDRQHRVLVHTLNQIIENLAQGSTRALGEQISGDLLGYALYHFEMEEALMRDYGYRDYSNFDARTHLAQHKAFSGRVTEMRTRIARGEALDLEPIVTFLHDWLLNHIMNTDVRLGRFILARRAAEDPA